MCGIFGIIDSTKKIDRSVVSKMISVLKHRGPDDDGMWTEKTGNVVIGHTRLSIIDLSDKAHQPMVSNDGRYVIAFNGEIYNFHDIKKELSAIGWSFMSNSDTEVLLYSYIEWKEECLQRLNGMFSFAIWDRENKELFAARDRIGKKPLKYYHQDGVFVFASEIKAILETGFINKELDLQAIDSALSLRFIPAPQTGFKNISKLAAGHFLKYKNNKVTIHKYWDIKALETRMIMDVRELKKTVWALFVDSVKTRLVSDVPVGSFLSGGLDSTSIIAALAELNVKNVDTFVISIGGKSFDEHFASIAARFFKTNHHEISLSTINYNDSIDALVNVYDEPFFDQSALPSMLISQQMKKKVSVVLSGDGGDELFGGYDCYKFAYFLQNYQKLPKYLYKEVIPMLLSFNKDYLYRAEVLSKDFFSAYNEYFSTWKTALPVSKKYITKYDLYTDETKMSLNLNFSSLKMEEWFGVSKDIRNDAMCADILGRLPDGYLMKTDMATMASGLELRCPFLDYRLVELSQQIPSRIKMPRQQIKGLWKEIVKDKMPKEIIDRKKMGFSIPLDRIFREDLREMTADILINKNNEISKFFSFKTVNKLWEDHLNNKADYSNHLWSLLLLELWINKYIIK